MYIFGRNDAGSFANGMTGCIYSIKFYDNDTLIRDYIPAQTITGLVGLYDKVNDKFYMNKGTGEFIAGPIISNNLTQLWKISAC